MNIKISAGVTFALVWTVPLLIPYFISNNPLITPVSTGVLLMILFNIILFFIFLAFFFLIGLRGHTSNIKAAIQRINFDMFSRKIDSLFYLWIFVYAINIIGSGGIPLLWILQSDPRTYVDFGLPTLGGLGNLIRAYVLTSCYLIIVQSKFNHIRKRRYIFIGVFLLISAFLLETGRGNGVVLLLHPVGLYFLLNDFNLKHLLKLFLSVLLFLFSLSLIQIIRYPNGYELLLSYAENSGFQNSTAFEIIMIPALMYIAIPVINTDLNFQVAEFFQFKPYYSLQGIIPTVFRDRIFENGDYGELLNEANNVSSFYIPFIRDFGQFGAFLIISLILFVAAYCYSKARQGNVYYILSYPPLFMSLALSFFSLFFTSLVVLLYPVLVYWSLRWNFCNNVR
jgi:oligosaccharide repeat unit polymerase